MQKKTPDYDNVFKTMKMKHKRLFVSVINDVFGRNYPKDVSVEILPSEGYLTESETADGQTIDYKSDNVILEDFTKEKIVEKLIIKRMQEKIGLSLEQARVYLNQYGKQLV